MELRHLRYFLVLAEELSFTAAAARLRISQPPLSQQIQDLETELKTTLFMRTSRKVELTPAGIAFLDHVRSILGQVGQAVEQTRAIGSGKSGKLDIGATGSVLLGPLASIIAAYSRQYPEVAVRLHEMAPLAQLDSLHARKTDISFLRSPTEIPNSSPKLLGGSRSGSLFQEVTPYLGAIACVSPICAMTTTCFFVSRIRALLSTFATAVSRRDSSHA